MAGHFSEFTLIATLHVSLSVSFTVNTISLVVQIGFLEESDSFELRRVVEIKNALQKMNFSDLFIDLLID